MSRRIALLAFSALLVTLTLATKVQSWGGYHYGYTHYSPYTGLQHYSYSRVYPGYGGYGGYRYGGYAYGYRGYGGNRYGYYRRW